MSHDFAKIRPEPLLEKKQVEAPPAWSLLLTGIVVGISIGVFASFLFYLSGHVPPLYPPSTQAVAPGSEVQSPGGDSPDATELKFEFYEELKDYEVPVPEDLVQVEVPSPDDPLKFDIMLQTGAFQQRERAYNEMERLRALGLEASVHQESPVPGRSLFLVQAGPYTTRGQLSSAERLLRNSNIRSMRLELR